MAYLEFNNIKIVGISAAIPTNRINNREWLERKGTYAKAEDLFIKTGIKERCLSYTHTGSDLSYYAADQLIKDLGWERTEIDALISVTSFPDFVMPNNACILQSRLGLSSHCYAHDIAVETSGWIYGLSSIASLMQYGNIKKAILLTGTGRVKMEDDVLDFMFGHAASAIAIEFDSRYTTPMCFYFGTDAALSDKLWVNQYGMRKARDKSRLKYRGFDGDDIFNVESFIDVEEQFKFSVDKSIETIKSLCDFSKCSLQNIDYLLLQQNSMGVLCEVCSKLGLEENKVPYSFTRFGNTGASSIPLTIVSNLKNKLVGKNFRLMCSACGDFSISAVSFELSDVTISNLIEVEE